MSIKEKIIVGALAALFVLALMALWAYFVTIGRADSQAFIAQIGVLITGAVSLVTIWCGHQAASSRSTAGDPTSASAVPGALLRDAPAADVTLGINAPAAAVGVTAPPAGTLQ